MSSSEETKAPGESLSEDWAMLPWRKLERHVYRLQKRIYQASIRGDSHTVHRMQQLLMRSRSAQLLAVRRVTQDNQGKKTAGIDGMASLSPSARLALVPLIHPRNQHRQKPKPVRRIWIPKPGKVEKRPLGIPVMYDRACQALAKQALEPEWEARFDAHSYGFRPGRGCHDAIVTIFDGIKQKAKYVLDADIKGCFDHIDHQALLNKRATYPAMRRTVHGWLTAGLMEGVEFAPTQEGTPQGGVLSPLLANIALHGLEEAVRQSCTRQEGQPSMIRYADDFVVLHPTKEGVEKAKLVAETWLQHMGLELKPSKTRIAYTLDTSQGKGGFDFLGFNVRQYCVGKTHSVKNQHGRLLGFKTFTKPTCEALKRHLAALGQIVKAHRNAPQEALIAALNPVIVGWANYYCTGVSKEAYSYCDHQLYQMLRHWARTRHPNKNARWVVHKYWAVDRGEGWLFKTQEGVALRQHVTTLIRRHVKVKGAASPYDGNLIYWAQRLKDHPLTSNRTSCLLRNQGGKCRYCGLLFKQGDILEVDHLLPQSLGGNDNLYNLQVLHRHCHDQKTVRDGSHTATEEQRCS